MAKSNQPFNKESYGFDGDIAVQGGLTVTGAIVAAGGITSISGVTADNYIRITVDINASSVDKHVFIADRAYQVVQIEEIHSVVGSTSAVVQCRKCTGTTAPASGAALQTATFDLTATINTTQTATNTATAADLLLADGDKIAIDVGGTLTNLVGVITITLAKK